VRGIRARGHAGRPLDGAAAEGRAVLEREQYSSETAKADLGYGRGIAVEGYKGMARPTAAPEPPPPEKKPKPEPTPEPKEKPSKEGEPSPRRRGLGILGWFGARRGAKRAPAETAPATEPEPTAPVEDMPVPVMKPPAAKSKSSFEVSPSLLARNYYRAGRDFYENNDFANAAKNFEKVLELTPKSNEALNASRLLSNIRLAQGKLALKSRAEKAAGAQFQKRQEQLSVKEEQQQVEFLEKGLKAAREGRLSEARAQLEAAGSLGRKLLEQGAGQREQHARLGVIEEKLAEVRDKEAGQAQVLYKEVEKLERAGDYEAALETARKLRNLGEASKQMRDKLLSLAEQTTRQRALQREAPRHEGGRPGRVTTIGGEELTTPKWEAELRETMASKKVSFDFVETPIQDTVAFLAGVTGANFVLDPDAVRDDAPTVTLKVQDMPVGKALDWLCKLANLKHTLRDEAVFISKPDRISDKPVLRMYDVTDLTIDIKDLSGRQRAVAKGKPDDDQETLTGEAVLERIRRTIAPGTWSRGDSKPDGKAGEAPGYTISYRNGRIVVVHQPEVNRQIEDLLANYRKVRGPQVELGGNIARQRAQGQAGKGIVLLTDGRDVSGAATGGGKPSGELRRFIWRNYDWQLRKTAEAQQAPQSAVPKMPDQAWDDLSEKLGFNLGQKVQVSSINLDIPAQAANQLGASFQTGNNGVVFTVVDEAQFRTLVELDSRKNRFGRSVPMNPRGQDTIVGTDALLANAWTANVRFAADRANTIDVNGNPINLAHDQYILIDNGSFLTAVRAGEMQHWTERSAPVQLADVPQDIDVPRVGQMVKFEKTLVEPDDELVLRASYSWKGEGR